MKVLIDTFHMIPRTGTLGEKTYIPPLHVWGAPHLNLRRSLYAWDFIFPICSTNFVRFTEHDVTTNYIEGVSVDESAKA